MKQLFRYAASSLAEELVTAARPLIRQAIEEEMRQAMDCFKDQAKDAIEPVSKQLDRLESIVTFLRGKR